MFANSNNTSAWQGWSLFCGVGFDVLLKAQDRVRFPLVPAEKRVARLAEQPADMAFGMAMVDEKAGCCSLANSATTALYGPERSDLFFGELVFLSEPLAAING